MLCLSNVEPIKVGAGGEKVQVANEYNGFSGSFHFSSCQWAIQPFKCLHNADYRLHFILIGRRAHSAYVNTPPYEQNKFPIINDSRS